MWKPIERNFDGIQHEKLRKRIDKKFNGLHDELSDCYYNKKPFRTYGILTKKVFDKFHGLIFHLRDVEFHIENLKQPLEDRIPEEEYENIYNEKGILVEKKSDEAKKDSS